MSDFIRGLLKLTLWLAVILAIVAAVLNWFFVKVLVVGHNAMAPTLLAGDQIAIWTDSTPEFGDITVCADPRGTQTYVVGRIVGKPGFVLDTVRDQFQINGQGVDQDHQGYVRVNDTVQGINEVLDFRTENLGKISHGIVQRKNFKLNFRKVQVKRGYFLLADNRSHPNQDSRFYGEVDPATCIGKVFLRLKPGSAATSPDEVPRGWLTWIK